MNANDITNFILGILVGAIIVIVIFSVTTDYDKIVEERLKLIEMCQNEIFYNSDSNYKRCDNIGVTPE